MPTPDEIAATFAAAEREITASDAETMVRWLASFATLDDAITAAGVDEAYAAQGLLIAYRSAIAQAADPEKLIARLEQEAESFDRLEEYHRREGANIIGRAIYREGRNDPFGAELRRQAEIAESCADEYQAKAIAKRDRVSELRAKIALAAAMVGVVTPRQMAVV